MKHKIFLAILTALAALGLCLGLAACDGEGTKDDLPGDAHLLYETDGDFCTVTGLREDCTDTKIVIPSTYEGRRVTAIAPMAFAGNTTVEEVSLPDSLETVDASAFDHCSSLAHVDLGEGLQAIGVQAFGSCTALEQIELPESLREIDAFAFQNSALKEVAIPDSVIRIGSMAFGYCTSLTKLSLGNGVKSLGSLAFTHTSVKEIVMPDSVTDLGYGCFSSNPSLESASIGRRCTALTYGTFFGCTSLETVTLNNICAIHDSAFGGCTGLRNVYFFADEEIWNTYCSVGAESDDNPVNSYGNTYFREADLYFYSETPVYDGKHWGYGEDGQRTVWKEPEEADSHLTFEKNETGDVYTVTGLDASCTDTKIVIPATYDGLPVTKIGRNALKEHDHIEEVVLPSSVTELGYGAFSYCHRLKTINFPKRLKTIGEFVFYDCRALEKAELPASLRELGSYAFSTCTKLQSVYLPKNVVMGMAAFMGCTSLTDVTLEEGLTELGINAFYGCTSLTAIDLPDSLTSVAGCAFMLSGLKEVVIPERVKSIGLSAFSGCTSLSKVTLPDGLEYIEARAFQSAALREVVIPDNVYEIGEQAFAFATLLERVTLGKFVTSCDYGSFALCTSLKTLTILNANGRISDAAFGGCSAIEKICFKGNEAAWETFAAKSIGRESADAMVEENGYGNLYLFYADVYCFSEEPVYDGAHWWYDENGNMVIGEKPAAAEPHLTFEKNEAETAYTVTGLDDACTDTKIVIPATYDNLPVTKIGENAFEGRDHIEEVELPSSVVEIGFGAFRSCHGLKTINFPKRLNTIGEEAFFDCMLLEKAELPASLGELGAYAFGYCEKLVSAFIPKHTALGVMTFYNCTALSEVTLEEGFDRLSPYAFASCTALTEIELPASLTDIGPYAFLECGLQEIVIPEGMKSIGLGAFTLCASLSKVTLPDGLEYIESYAFQKTALEEVVIPYSVYQIGTEAFAYIETLRSVVLGGSLAVCDYAAFAICPSLTTVTILNCTGFIFDAAFGGCDKIDTVYFNGCNVGAEEEMTWEDFRSGNIFMESADADVEENGYGNRYLYNAQNVYLYSEEPIADGKHWHLDENGSPQLWTETD